METETAIRGIKELLFEEHDTVQDCCHWCLRGASLEVVLVFGVAIQRSGKGIFRLLSLL